MRRLLLEAVLLGGVCLLFAGSTSVADIIVAVAGGGFAALWHARLLRHSAFRFMGRPRSLHVVSLALKGGLRDVPRGGWHVLASLWRGRYGKRVTEPAPALIDGASARAIPKQRALAILATSFGPLAYALDAHHHALHMHRAEGTRRSA
jgi:hypothetical protein